MKLTQANYHDLESNKAYLSASQIKQAIQCESAWAATVRGDYKLESSGFLEGHYFELMLTAGPDEIALFQSQNPEMFSSTGATKGQLKANFKKVESAIEAVWRQDLLMQIINNADKQVIMTGEIQGVPVKAMVDLMLPKSKSIYDLKAMANFNRAYSEQAEMYVDWFMNYRYDVQMWIYAELARQNGFVTDTSKYGLIAASKQENSDVKALVFGPASMQNAESDALYVIGRIERIREGEEPIACGKCPWCLSQKVISQFEEV